LSNCGGGKEGGRGSWALSAVWKGVLSNPPPASASLCA